MNRKGTAWLTLALWLGAGVGGCAEDRQGSGAEATADAPASVQRVVPIFQTSAAVPPPGAAFANAAWMRLQQKFDESMARKDYGSARSAAADLLSQVQGSQSLGGNSANLNLAQDMVREAQARAEYLDHWSHGEYDAAAKAAALLIDVANGPRFNGAPEAVADAEEKYARAEIRMGTPESYEVAVKSAREAARLTPGDRQSPPDLEARRLLAEAELRRGLPESRQDYLLAADKDSETALRLESAMESDPRRSRDWKPNPLIHEIRACVLEIGGRRDAAIAELKQASDIDPSAYGPELQAAGAGGRICDAFQGSEKAPGTVVGPRVLAVCLLFAVLLVGSAWLWRRRSDAARAEAAAAGAAATAAAGPAAAAGSRLAGKYELVRIIGCGGMGEVYEAIDHSLGRPVAVKKMTGALAAQGSMARELYLKEARTVAALHHPAIIDIYEILEPAGELYLVFEFVQGKTVDQLLAESHAMGLARSRHILRPVCDALQFAHDRNMVHRDLKPANIMITDRGVVKLMDFGIARSLRDAGNAGPPTPLPRPAPPTAGADPGAPAPLIARTQMVVGTPQYMAPEAEEGIVRKEADVYALGACLYEMTTGRPAFRPDVTLEDKINMKFTRPSALVPGLPPALDALVALAMQPDPDKRIHSPKEFLARLDSVPAA